MIELRNITAGYENNIIFENYSLALPERGVVCVTGPSGKGKSTLLRILACMLKPKSGSIEGLTSLRVSMVFQENRLLPWRTALENTTLPILGLKRNADAIALEWLDKMELLNERHAYPATLSGGMQRRVALARAAAYQGDLLLLDEPFTGLDNRLRDRVATQLQSAAPLIVLVSHDANDARAMGASITIAL